MADPFQIADLWFEAIDCNDDFEAIAMLYRLRELQFKRWRLTILAERFVAGLYYNYKIITSSVWAHITNR